MSFFNFGLDFSTTPKRPLNAKSPTIPFCTSPSQLQEVTLDQDATFSNTMGIRSPGGPTRGRSVKEIEEQLSNLKKENFNLKLRIYFLEEKMGAHFTLDKDNIVKKYIELQVEFGNLQKELDEKHDLLCQAVKAMELEEEEHKKYVASKEDQLNMCQQELEDLRMQLQDTKFDSDGISLKSDTTGFYSSRALNNGNLITELQERVKILETELHLEKENNASLQFYIGHAETLKTRYENAQKECSAKDATIKNLHDEIETSNSKLSAYTAQLSQMQAKLDIAGRENDSLAKRIRTDCRKFEELTDQLSELRKKYLNVRTDYERAEKLKIAGESRAKELEEENRRHQDKIGELRDRLEAATVELRKNQNLAVLSSPERQTPPDAHPRSLSVQDAAAPAGAAEAHPPHVPVAAKQPPTPLLAENEAQKLKLVKLKKEQFKACEIIKNMISSRNKANEEIAQLRRQVKELEKELESVVSKPASDKEDGLPSKGEREESMAKSEAEEEMDIAEHYKALIVELEAKVEILLATLNEKDIQMQNLRKQYDEILTRLEEKDNKLADMEFELLCTENAESSTSFSEKHSVYCNEIEEKNKKIEKLTEELKKCTCYLQEIVNKELWDKNKEIEKLYNKHSNSPDACKLKNELSKREEQIKQLSAKISNLKIDNERSEKQRADSNELCALLNSRLEELALFLDSLLKHKSVLGFLGLHKEKRLRGLVNSSLDLSKSFANSLMVSGDHTLAQLTNITALLDVSEFPDLSLKEEETTETLTIIPDDVTLTYQSHLYKKDNPDKDAVILALREQIVNLKSELQLRDTELSKLSLVPSRTSESDAGQKDVSKLFLTPVKCNTTSTTLKYQSECLSESEGWSEPDRVVSRARIGLSRTAPDFLSIAKDLSESTEEESTCSLTPTKRSFDKRSGLELNELQEEIRMMADKIATVEARLAKSVDMSLFEELKERLTEAESSLADARKRKQEADIKVAVLQRTIEELNKDKEELKESVNVKDKEIKDLINTLEVEKEEAKKQVESYERDAIKAKRDIMDKDMKFEELQNEMKVLEASLRSKYEQFAIEKLRSAEEEFLMKIKLGEKKAEDNMRHLQDCYAREYVKKSEVEEKLLQVEQLSVEMDKLKTAVALYEETVQAYKQKNNELGSKLAENQNKLNHLHKELDTTTLQFSEAVLEKTKLASAKNAMEQELNRLVSRGTELEQLLGLKEHQVADIRTEFDKVQKQKSNLEVKLSEMESTNAELHNKLVKMQASRNEVNLSLPKSASRGSNRQYLNGNYGCDDQISFHSNAGQPMAKPLPVFEADRQEANSSPDLGIESDQGRFSSLETHSNNVQRPLLQTIELTETMSNLLDGEGHLENVNYCGSDCCNRSTAFAQENSELKRKLLRMRRALDETAAQLALANQRKKQVEKVICKQIHKTSQVLRKAKANLDSGSESDLLDK